MSSVNRIKVADKSSLLKAFNTLFFSFLDDIIEIFPENDDIAVAKTSFEGIKKWNASIIIKVWFQYIYTPYNEYIDRGDISFFINKDYNADLAYLANASDVMIAIDKIRNPIKEMGEVNQQHSMTYIQKLSRLAVAYDEQ